MKLFVLLAVLFFLSLVLAVRLSVAGEPSLGPGWNSPGGWLTESAPQHKRH